MTDKEILDYIAANPKTGREKLAKLFDISDRRAGELKSLVKNAAQSKDIQFLDKDKLLDEICAEKGLSREQLIDILTPKKEYIRRVDTADSEKFSIGIVSDTHMGDKACAINELSDIYKRFDACGVECVVHAGDWTAGDNVYRGQYNDLLRYGYNDQVSYARDNYPELANGGKTYGISGNHDLSFKVGNGAHFLSALADKRPDIVDLGDYDADISIGGVKVALHHGDGGGSYAVSYKLQKFIELTTGRLKPQIYILGHYHTSLYMFLRNVHCFMPGCFQLPNDFSIRKKLPNTIGGWVLNVTKLNDEHNTIRSIQMEYISYYD